MDVIVLFIFAALAAGAAVKLLLDKKRNDQRVRQSVMAEVVQLRMENPAGRYGRGLYTRYYAVFRLTNAKELTFSIPEAEYERLAQGDRGELTYRGWQYLFFSRRG